MRPDIGGCTTADDADRSGELTVTNTQGWQDWQPRSSPQNQDDLLYKNLALPNGSPQSFTVTLDALYLGVMVVIESPGQNDMQVIFDNQGLVGVQQQQTQILGGAGTPGTFFFPARNFLGDTVKITLSFTSALTGGQIAIYGVRSIPGIGMRADGRTHPLGSIWGGSQGVAAVGATTLVFASSAPSRFLIKSVSLAVGAGPNGNAAYLYGTLGAAVAILASGVSGSAAGATMAIEWESGILLDPATGIVLQSSQATYIAAAVLYDIVV